MRKKHIFTMQKLQNAYRLFLTLAVLLLQLTFGYSQSGGLITNVTSTSGKPYYVSQLAVGATIYSDRTYQATAVPDLLNNAPFIRTPNDDKGNKSASLLTFTLTQNATVYVAYDPRATTLPAWLNGWEKLTIQLGINDPKISNMTLYSKSYAAGTVTLGGNLAAPAAGALNEYVVIALAQVQGTQYNLNVTISGDGMVTKTPNQANYAPGTVVSLTATPGAGQQFNGWSGDASGTANPLDITMDANKSVTASFGLPAAPKATVTPLNIYDNDVVGGGPGTARTVKIRNTGTGVLSVSGINLAGANSTQFVLSGLPVFPKNINEGDSISFSVAFNPSSLNVKSAQIKINSNDASSAVITIPMRGLATAGLGGANEPSLQSILNLFEIQTDAGDDDASTAVINSSSTSQKAPLLGEEISMQSFQKAGPGPVTITPLAVFGPTDNATIVAMGWYKSGNASSKTEMLSVSNNPLSNGQTVNVNFTGTLSFDPAAEPFGFYSRWPYFADRHLYSEDALNTFASSIPHHVRIYPYKKNGVVSQDTYVVAFEEHISGFDYQDLLFLVSNVKKFIPNSQKIVTIAPSADAFVRGGTYAALNHGNDTSLIVKASSQANLTRFTYLKFPLDSLAATGKVNSAVLRVYGKNTENNTNVNHSVLGVDDDSWTETGITFNNAPATANPVLSTLGVNDEAKYYEFDVTSFVRSQLQGDKVASFLIKDLSNKNRNIAFNSKEALQNPPELVVDNSSLAVSNALLFVENLDKFPANDHFVFSRVQKPWSRDSVYYNTNHDSLKVRIHNKGIEPLIITKLSLSNATTWTIDKINATPYNPGLLPLSVNTGGYIDVTLKFIAYEQASRVKVLHETFTITSNDSKFPEKTVYLHGIWQRSGEGDREPTAQEIIDVFGFKTQVGFVINDPDMGDSTKLKGDEIKPSFFVRANPNLPVTSRQMAAYHGCCTSTEKLYWYERGTTTLNTVYTHIASEAQTVLPKQSNGSPANGTFTPTVPFGFKIGYVDLTDASKNPGKKIGIRVWRAIDAQGRIIPNAYIIANDYLGSDFTNYDYNDNTHFVTNIRPVAGSAFYSELAATPSALDFGEKVLQANDSLVLNIKSLGKTYATGPADPALTISSIEITGENSAEFSVDSLTNPVLNPQQSSTLKVRFKPLTQGLKIADLLIHYNNSPVPLRVPLYGIAKASNTTVAVHYRVKGGRNTPITVNGKTWSADTPYAFDNLEPYKASSQLQIAGTDDDSLYVVEQSSNGDKKPFRYQFNLPNGDYVVRLHFAEIYWGVAGAGFTGGAGSRIFSVKLEGQYRLLNLDLVQEVGAAAALIKNLPVTVSDGKLNIDFSATVNRPMVSAIEIYSFSAPAARPAEDVTQNTVNVTAQQAGIPGYQTGKPRVYPNPLVSPQFNIQFPSRYQGVFNLQLVDITGRKYNLGRTRLNGAGQAMKVDVSGLQLKPGVYFLRIISDRNTTDMLKLLLK